MLSFDPARESVQNIYKLMIGAIVPRPIAFVSSLDARGVRNLAPFSFFTGVSADPPVVLFCASVRPEDAARRLAAHKDTLLNVIATREFVINVVTEAIVEKMNLTSAQVPPDVDEFELAGLTPEPSEVGKAAARGGKPGSDGVPIASDHRGQRPPLRRQHRAG